MWVDKELRSISHNSSVLTTTTLCSTLVPIAGIPISISMDVSTISICVPIISIAYLSHSTLLQMHSLYCIVHFLFQCTQTKRSQIHLAMLEIKGVILVQFIFFKPDHMGSAGSKIQQKGIQTLKSAVVLVDDDSRCEEQGGSPSYGWHYTGNAWCSARKRQLPSKDRCSSQRSQWLYSPVLLSRRKAKGDASRSILPIRWCDPFYSLYMQNKRTRALFLRWNPRWVVSLPITSIRRIFRFILRVHCLRAVILSHSNVNLM